MKAGAAVDEGPADVDECKAITLDVATAIELAEIEDHIQAVCPALALAMKSSISRK